MSLLGLTTRLGPTSTTVLPAPPERTYTVPAETRTRIIRPDVRR